MSITSTGSGLSLLINCWYVPHHHWMTFASWYSVKKFLPDAEVSIHCNRQNGDYRWPLFGWAVKLRAKFSYNRPKNFSGLEIQANTMAVRTWQQNDNQVVMANSNEISTFVNYGDGCGNFVMAEWINSLAAPFEKVPNLINGRMELTLNERKVFDIWEQLLPVYLQIGSVHA